MFFIVCNVNLTGMRDNAVSCMTPAMLFLMTHLEIGAVLCHSGLAVLVRGVISSNIQIALPQDHLFVRSDDHKIEEFKDILALDEQYPESGLYPSDHKARVGDLVLA